MAFLFGVLGVWLLFFLVVGYFSWHQYRAIKARTQAQKKASGEEGRVAGGAIRHVVGNGEDGANEGNIKSGRSKTKQDEARRSKTKQNVVDGRSKTKVRKTSSTSSSTSSLCEKPPVDLFKTFLHHQENAKWIQDLFENSCALWPDRACFKIAGWGRAWTYAEFAQRAEAVKSLLETHCVPMIPKNENNVDEKSFLSSLFSCCSTTSSNLVKPLVSGPDQIVGVMLPLRGCWEAFVSQLGIWKAGGGMVFLDPDLPDELLQGMIQVRCR